MHTASCSWRSATWAHRGGGTNIFRGHDNVQGATDLGVLAHTLPGYYGLSGGAWAHWARVWEEDLDWLKGSSHDQGADGKDKSLMNLTGIPVSRWIDGVLEDPDNMDQPDKVRAMVLWGHAPNSQTRDEGNEDGDGKARHAGRGGSLSRPSRRFCMTGRMAFTCCRPVRSSKPAVR